MRCPAGSVKAGELDVAHMNSWSHGTNYPPIILSGEPSAFVPLAWSMDPVGGLDAIAAAALAVASESISSGAGPAEAADSSSGTDPPGSGFREQQQWHRLSSGSGRMVSSQKTLRSYTSPCTFGGSIHSL